MPAPPAITAAMRQMLRDFKDVCADNGIAPCTFKHRGRQGTESTDAPTGNIRWKHSVATTSLPATTDYQVYAFWDIEKQRGNQADGGDTAAAAAYIPRARGEMCSVATDGQTIVQVMDADWLVVPDGDLFRIENPTISPDGSFWVFEMVRQR